MEEQLLVGKVNGGNFYFDFDKNMDFLDGEKMVLDFKENNNENFFIKYYRLGSELFVGNVFFENVKVKEERSIEQEEGFLKEVNFDEEGRKLDGQSRIFY